MLEALRLASRSLIGKFVALAAIFLVVPVILYQKFAAADAERQAFLLRSLQVQGRLVAEGLEPLLTSPGGRSLLDATKAVSALASDPVHIKLLLRPAGRRDSFFLVAASPAIQQADLENERQKLDLTGVLARLDESCAGQTPLAVRYAGPSGQQELLTSMSPLHAPAGCWVIITSYATEDLAGSLLDRPFSQAPEVQLAMVIYGMMAVLMAMAIAGMLLDLRSFARLARRIRQGGGPKGEAFAKVAAIPELLPVAREFDRMVATLDASAGALREAAEDTAHAFKAPMAAITQSLEPLRSLSKSDPPAAGSIEVIEHALARLSNLVAATRRLDETAAELIKAKLEVVNLAALAGTMAGAYHRLHSADGLTVTAIADGPAKVSATEESLETVLENLLDNAVSFSPPNGTVRVRVSVKAGMVHLSVEDQGPGVPPEQLDRIFRRNFTERPGDRCQGDSHSGIGLAVVRRTIEMLGGQVHAENISGSGLKIGFTLPGA